MVNVSEKKLGWDYITEAFENIYPDQTNPLHLGTIIKYHLGGNDPLDGISIYDGGDFFHFVTFGFSELYEKESEVKEYSGYGFELTVKIKKTPNIDEMELKSLAGVLQSLASYVFQSGNVFHPNQYIYTGQENGMDSKGISKITGFATASDDLLNPLNTDNGKLEFIQLIGLTDNELKSIVDNKNTVEEIIDKIGNTLTDFTRNDVI